MPRIGITKQEVFAVIEEMCAVREKVTTLNIHARLGRGSINTIHKHLVVWKQNRLWSLKQSNNDENKYDPEIEEHLVKQQELNQELSRELLTTQREVMALKQKLAQYKEEITQLKVQSQQAQHNATLWAVKFTSHIDERDTAYSAFIAEKERQIVSVQQELFQAHKDFADQSLAMACRDQDQLLAEKVKVCNLEDRVVDLKKHNEELQLKLSYAEQAIQPYQQQLRDFERLANKLGLWEKFLALEKG